MDTDSTESQMNKDEQKAAEEFVAPTTGYAPVPPQTENSVLNMPDTSDVPTTQNISNPETISNIEEESQPHSRREVLVRAIKEFLTGNFEKGKEHLQYISLQKELEKRGVISEGYYPGSLAILQSTERTLYAYKEILSKFSAFVDPNNPSSLSGMTSIRKELTNRISDNNPISLDERRDLDQDFDDSTTLNFMKADFAAQEAKRQTEISENEQRLLAEALAKQKQLEQEKTALRERQIEETKTYNDYLENDFPRQKKEIEYWDNLITYSESTQENEERSYGQVEEIINRAESNELAPDDIGVLSKWLNIHKEFGLKEMSDEEYFAFFQDGKIYAHNTSFFGDQVDYGDTHYWTPRFIEALKDGCLMGHDIGEERGDQTYTNTFPERNVSFDGPDLLARGLYRPKGDHSIGVNNSEMTHFEYAITVDGPEMSPPVVLIAPKRILETHSTNIKQQQEFKRLIHSDDDYVFPGQDKQSGEGEHFGSTRKDPLEHSHEINLNLFVAVLPDMLVSSKFINNMLENISSDHRTTEAIKSEISRLQLDRDSKGIDFKGFMIGIQKIMADNDFIMPRLFFYKPAEDFTGSSDPSWIVRSGVQNFLSKCQTTQPPQSNESIPQYNPEVIPERYKLPQWKLEEVANQVRTILKKHQNTQSEALPLAA